MLSFTEIFYVIVCLLLILVVIIQNSSSGGLGGLSGQSSNNVRKKLTPLTKFSLILSSIFFILAFTINYQNKIDSESNEEKILIIENKKEDKQ